tara:strand:- start:295 stop:849 length:555 start_codon:yes stop_codon:yes gene_type:complete
MKTYFSDNLIIPENALNIYTTNAQAMQINKIIKIYADSSSVITDATACIGGNSVFFIKDFKRVNLVEKDYSNFKILKMNTGCPNTTYNCSYLWIKFMLIQDIIYFDPPWGGSEYKSKKKIDLFLDDVNILDIIDELYNYTKIVALKVPNNFNVFKIEDNFWLHKIYNITKCKKNIYKLIIFYKR